ncbi:unnamed protein product [Cylindrotheca closterium]|uniref:Ankyrin repeat protein n=1 Tax=Cylindrotheca closterium TaxID=2856 RepID=A0AAD2FER4_9STRA|nr:unnamed protein product [Cylindrotheca closterium]
MACRHRNTQVAQHLLGAIESLDRQAFLEARGEDGFTPLYAACARGFEPVVQFLLNEGSNLEAKDETIGLTPLIAASAAGELQVVLLLLRRGADIEAMDNDHMTSLHYASFQGHHEVVTFMLDWVEREGLDRNAIVEAMDRFGKTPLCWACEAGHLEVAEVLLDAGANAKAADDHGFTLLHLASLNGH